MLEVDGQIIFDSSALLDRLTSGLKASNRQVVFVVGSPLTAPHRGGQGVDDVGGIVQLIRSEFALDPDVVARLDAAIHAADNKYQAAFQFLQGRRGQDAANRVIRQAVLNANTVHHGDRTRISAWSEDLLSELELKTVDWSLSPGVAGLGQLLAMEGAPFGSAVITSNFDPLIEIATRSAGGQSWRTSLHSDGDFGQSSALGCQVVHIHGYWLGSDTLHTGNQLLQSRPFLKNSLL